MEFSPHLTDGFYLHRLRFGLLRAVRQGVVRWLVCLVCCSLPTRIFALSSESGSPEACWASAFSTCRSSGGALGDGIRRPLEQVLPLIWLTFSSSLSKDSPGFSLGAKTH